MATSKPISTEIDRITALQEQDQYDKCPRCGGSMKKPMSRNCFSLYIEDILICSICANEEITRPQDRMPDEWECIRNMQEVPRYDLQPSNCENGECGAQ